MNDKTDERVQDDERRCWGDVGYSRVDDQPPEMHDRRRWQDAYGESLAVMTTVVYQVVEFSISLYASRDVCRWSVFLVACCCRLLELWLRSRPAECTPRGGSLPDLCVRRRMHPCYFSVFWLRTHEGITALRYAVTIHWLRYAPPWTTRVAAIAPPKSHQLIHHRHQRNLTTQYMIHDDDDRRRRRLESALLWLSSSRLAIAMSYDVTVSRCAVFNRARFTAPATSEALIMFGRLALWVVHGWANDETRPLGEETEMAIIAAGKNSITSRAKGWDAEHTDYVMTHNMTTCNIAQAHCIAA